MKVHNHRELQLIFLVGILRNEKLHKSRRNRKRWDETIVVQESSVHSAA